EQGGAYSLVGMDDHCVMSMPLHSISNQATTNTFALVAVKRTMFPRVIVVGLKKSEDLEKDVTEGRLMRRGVSTDNQETMQWEIKPKSALKDGDTNSVGYGKIHLRRHLEAYLIKVEAHETWTELSFKGDPSLTYHLAFECDKGSVMLMGRRDLTIYLVTGAGIRERPTCMICHLSTTKCEVFSSCGHFTCTDCLAKVKRTCRECPVCKKDWVGGPDKTEKGFLFDSYCRFDDCMEFTVLNLPCRCITCHRDKQKCTRCSSRIHQSIQFFY
ncbi:hypothetical protein PMAYCL1PPCAC_18131, partial [Pristionchus mayeri]